MSGLPKGPWSASLDGHGAFSIESATGNQICFVRNAEAALLISAAPELLEALLAVVQVVQRHTGRLDAASGTPMARAFAAIAKATGEA